MMYSGLLACSLIIGGMANEIKHQWSKDQERVEKWIADSPSAYVTGLNIRLTGVERDAKAIPELKQSVDRLNINVAKLSGQVELLTARLPLK